MRKDKEKLKKNSNEITKIFFLNKIQNEFNRQLDQPEPNPHNNLYTFLKDIALRVTKDLKSQFLLNRLYNSIISLVRYMMIENRMKFERNKNMHER